MQYFCLFINETHQTGNLKVINFILNVIVLFILLTTNTPQCNRYSSNDQIWVENYWINWFITFKFLHFLGLYRHIFIYIYLCLDLFMYIRVPFKMDKICCIFLCITLCIFIRIDLVVLIAQSNTQNRDVSM